MTERMPNDTTLDTLATRLVVEAQQLIFLRQLIHGSSEEAARVAQLRAEVLERLAQLAHEAEAAGVFDGPLFADMQRRYERAGSTLHAVHQMRRDIAVMMGDRAAADRAR